MQLNSKCRAITLVLTVVLAAALLLAMPLQVFADNHTPVEGLGVGVSDANSDKLENGVLTVTVKGNKGFLIFPASSNTATITIANNKGNSAKISFDWTVTSNVTTLVIDGATTKDASGSYNKTLASGESLSITVESPKGDSGCTFTMSNFASADLIDSKVTVRFDEGNSVHAGGTAIKSGDVVDVPADGLTFSASSENFAAWIDVSNNTFLSLEPTFNLQATANMEIQAVHTIDPAFSIGTTYVGSLSDAITAAQKGTDKTIVLIKSGTLPAGDYVIPDGIT
jgi:hypothetical protein